MTTSVPIDKRLIAEAKALGKHRTARATVAAALREYIERQKRLGITKLFGKVEHWDDYNHKNLRKGKTS
jgi:hypothetical protein